MADALAQDPDFEPLPAEQPDPDFEPLPAIDLEAEDRQKNELLRSVFKDSFQVEPNRQAAVIKLQKGLQLKSDVVERNFDALKGTWEASQFDAAKWRKDNPELAKLALEHPELGTMVMKDPGVSVLTKAWNHIWDNLVEAYALSGPRMERAAAEAQPEAFATPEAQAKLQKGNELIARNEEERALRDAPKQTAYVRDGKTQAMQQLGPIERPLVRTIARYQESAKQFDISKAQFELLMRRAANEQSQLRRDFKVPEYLARVGESDTYELEKRIQDMKLEAGPPRDYGEDALGQVATDVAQSVASEVAVLKDAGKGAAVGAGAGAVIGGVLGYVTGGPGGAARGAGKGALKGASWLGKAGMALGSLQLEAGSMYGQLLETKKDDGTHLTEAEARGGALLYGGLAAIVETWSTTEMLKALGPLGKGLVAGTAKAAFADLMARDVTFRAILGRAGKEWVKATSAEAKEELIQEALGQLVTYLDKSKSQGAWQKGPIFNTQELLDSFWKGGVGAGLGIGAGGMVMNVTTHSLANDRAIQAGKTVKALAGAADSATVQAAPEAVAKMVEQATEARGEKVTHLYVEPNAFVKLFQDEKADPNQAITELMGPEGPRLLQEAIATGSKLEVPVGDYLAKWGGRDVAKALADDTTTQPGRLTPRQALEEREQIEARAKQLAEEFDQNNPAKEGEELAFVDELEKQLINTQTYSPQQARTQVSVWRAFVRNLSETFKVPVDVLFRDFRVTAMKGDNASSVVASARAYLQERAGTLSSEQRGSESYIDNNTGLLNERAFHEMPAPKDKPLVGHISVEGVKFLNDKVSHDRADLLYRMVGRALHDVDPTAAKVGGDFAVRVKDAAELQALVDLVNESLPVKGFAVTGAVGQTFKEAGAAHGAMKAAAEEAGTRAKRGEAPLGLPEGTTAEQLVFPAEKARAQVPARLAERVAKLTPEQYFKERYLDPETGVLTAEGWLALPRKKNVIAFDLRGLKRANELHGEKMGDRLIAQFARIAAALGGEGLDFAHLHGDEFAAQHDSPHAAQAFVAHLQEAVAANPVAYFEKEVGEYRPLPVEFRFGLGEWSYEAADRDLNERKKAEQPSGAAGELDFGDSPEAEVGVQRGGRPGSGAVAGGSEGGDQGGAAEAGAAPQQVAPGSSITPLMREALRYIIKLPEAEQQVALDWYRYATGITTERPKRPDAKVERKLAEYGVVDPEGYGFDEKNRSIEGRGVGGRKVRGKEPDELRRQRLREDIFKTFGDMRGRYEQPAKPPPLPSSAERVSRTVATHEERIRSEKVEHAVAVGPDGKVLFTHSTDENGQVQFEPQQLEALNKSGQATFTHNHPGGTMLTVDDLMFAFSNNLREMRAVGPDGAVWRVLRPEGGWSRNISDETLRSALQDAHASAVERATRRMLLAIHEAGGDPADGAKAKGFTDELWRRLTTEERVRAFNELAKGSEQGWQVERLEPRRTSEEGAGREAGDRRQGAGVQAAGSEPNGQLKLFAGEPANPRGYTELAREGAQRVLRIALNKNADLSTFLHESGHAFLEILGDLSERADAPERVRQDFDTLLKWFGVEKRSEIQRDHHEKFARAWERYLFEGKAPIPKLEGAFQRFKLWMKRVYASIAELNVELNDEVRGVFDRLLATDQELERTKQAMGFRVLSPEEAQKIGLTGEKYQTYLDEAAQATSLAEKQLELRVLKDRLRETEEWWKEEEQNQREVAEKQYDELPTSKALAMMRAKDSEVRIDPKAAAYALGREVSKKLKGLMKKGGAHPDDLADLFGFPTGRAMLEELERHPEKDAWVNRRTAELMSEKYPDVLTDRNAMREAAAKGLHGQQTAQWLFREYEALRAKAVSGAGAELGFGYQPPGYSPIEAIEKAAQLIAQRRTVRRLDAGASLAAERAAADKATKAAARGLWAQAAVYKQQQLLNMFIHRELAAARAERDAFLDLADKLSVDTARARLGKASPIYRDGVDLILEGLGLKPLEQREKPLASLPEVVGKMVADGATVLFDEEVVGQLLQVAASSGTFERWKDMSVAQMREVHAALKNIQAAARALSTVLLDGKREDKAQVIEQLEQEAAANLPHLGKFASSESAMTTMEKLGGVASSIDGQLLKPETMVKWLAGGDLKSTWFRAIVKPLQQAKAAEVDLLNKVVKPILEAWQKLPKEAQRHFADSVDGKVLFPTHREDLEAPTKRYELLMIALNAGNQSNLDRLTGGRGITEQEVFNAINLLTKEEMDWVQSVWDANESLWPAARDLEERDSGLAPPKIEPKALQTRHGVYRGGYFPAVYDRRVEQVGERQVGDALAALMDPSFTRPSTARSHLKSRAESFSGALSLEPRNIPAHLAQVVHDLAYREALKSAGGLILSPKIQAVLKQRLGDGRAGEFLQWLKDVGQMRGVEHGGALYKAARKLRSNSVIAALGFAVPNMIEDLSNFAAAIPRTDLKAKHLAAALFDFTRAPIEQSKLAEAKSGELRTRRAQLSRELSRAVAKLTSTGILARGPLEWVRHHAFALMEASDWFTSTPIWIGAYRQALLAGESEADAITKADATIREVFPSHSPVDQAGILRDKGFLGTSLVFYGFLSTYYNGLRDILHPLHTAEDATDAAKRIPRVGGRLLAYMIAVGVLSEFLRGRGREGDEDWEQWFLRKLLSSGASALPFGGEFANAVEGGLMGKKTNNRNTSLATTGITVWQALVKLYKEVEDEGDNLDKRVGEFLRSLGPVVGFPTAQPGRTLPFLRDVATGDAEVRNPFDAVGGVVYGQRPGQPVNPASAIGDAISGDR